MNFFYDLPEELQDKIYGYLHESNFKNCILKINSLNKKKTLWRAQISRILYSSGMPDSELEKYFTFLDWVDGNPRGILQNFEFNIYYQAFNDFWLYFDEPWHSGRLYTSVERDEWEYR